MSNCTVSVIIPCYNMQRFIFETMRSVVQQTFRDWEMILVDDGSTDRTYEIIKEFAKDDSRIKHAAKAHTGIADTRNQCIQMAEGRFLAFLDADDFWFNNKLEVQLEFMRDQNLGFCYTSYCCVNEEGDTVVRNIKTAGNLDYQSYLRNTIIGCSTVMIDRDRVGDVMVPNFRTSEDSATWLKILKKGHKAYALDKFLTYYRIRSRSASSNKLQATHDLWKVYRQQEKLPVMEAAGYFASYAFNAIKKRL
jgi:teichuronic acid biosynthesis glycosyltransferase TuaG